MEDFNYSVQHSVEIDKISAAFLAFDTTVSPILKDSKNPFFNSRYASLSIILASIAEPLLSASLTVRQFPVGLHALETWVIHAESGQYFKATMSMPPTKQDPQGQGSAITYMRRYAIAAILGLNIDDDDDGNKASQEPDQAKKATNGKPVQGKTFGDKELVKYKKHIDKYADDGLTGQEIIQKIEQNYTSVAESVKSKILSINA